VKYVLDTNTLSFAMAGEPSVCDRLLSHSRTDVILPQPAISEIEYGLARLPRSKRRDRLLTRFHMFLDEMPRAHWTDEVSHAFGRTKADLERRGLRLEDFDVAVAAHALALGGTLVTDNLDHMRRVPDLHVENWRVRTTS
jgi:predicted nucleic acid-binding protein